ncbi:uncharacterized protein LOC142796273 [Rhipicephalus microplus]|uniref:uncharacterized protein LOC142796273 n=1 Tax=Rhipicephalus microplus TaxID=6941 RepID=UPI003F6CD474
MKSGASLDTSPRHAVYLWLQDSRDQHTTGKVGKANMLSEKTTGLSDVYFSTTRDRKQRWILRQPWAHTMLKTVSLVSAMAVIHLFRPSSFRRTVRDVKPWQHNRQKAACAGVCNAYHLSLPSEELRKE